MTATLEAPNRPTHRFRVRPDGTAYQAMCEAMSRLDDGDFLPAEEPRLDTIVAAYWSCVAAAERDAKTAPNGCAICGFQEQDHGIWHGGGHLNDAGRWIAPTNRKRLDRMMARRAYAAGRSYAAVDRLFARAIPTCGVCRKRPATLATDCHVCFSLSLDLESRWER